MSNKQIKAINFLSNSEHKSVKFFLYGNEHALCYKSKKHCLKDHDLQLLEKIYLNGIEIILIFNVSICLESFLNL